MGCPKITYRYQQEVINVPPLFVIGPLEKKEGRAETYVKNTPYRFNAKEVDQETGLHYYGARYYNSNLSVWLSVDPLAMEYPSYSPYNFVLNNPVSYQDPNGMWVEDGDGNWVAEEGDSWWTFHEQTGMSWDETKQFAKDYNTARGNDNWKSVYTGDQVSLGGEGEQSSQNVDFQMVSANGAAIFPLPLEQAEEYEKRSMSDNAASGATAIGLIHTGTGSLINAAGKASQLAPAVQVYTKTLGPFGSVLGVGASYWQRQDAIVAGDDLAKRKAELRMTTNSVSWIFPIGTAVWLGGEASLLLNPDMHEPQAHPFTQNTVCFIEGTMISTPDGMTPIEHVNVGDFVLSANSESLRIGNSVVKEVMKTEEKKVVYVIELEGGDSISLSESHPIYIIDGGWRSINPDQNDESTKQLGTTQLQVGDEVMTLLDSGELISQRVTSIRTNGKMAYMYNLVRVDEDNTFFANRILVHNKFISQ